jgi:hypothetical protein
MGEWKIQDGETIVVTDSTGLKRFVGTKSALMMSYVWLLQEFDRIREEMPLLPPRIEAALRHHDYEDEEDKSTQTALDKTRIRLFYEKIKSQFDFVQGSSIARQKFIADLLRDALNPLQRATEDRLTNEEATAAGHFCPSCKFINYSLNPIVAICASCGKKGYDCCVSKDADLCFDCFPSGP